MAELKTKRTNASVIDFIHTLDDERKKQDSLALLDIMHECTGEVPAMWGDSMIGYGSYHYKSDRSKQQGDWPMIGFSPRKQNLTVYIMPGFDNLKSDLEKLGKHKTSVSCLYFKKLADIDITVLKQIITKSYTTMQQQYGHTQ
jgi:Domain of unknown function (DU1801)